MGSCRYGPFSGARPISGVKPYTWPPSRIRCVTDNVGGVVGLKTDMETRACDLALYIIEQKATVRAAARQFGISKSTVHKDLSQRLPSFNRPLYLQVRAVLDQNKAERHIRGGIATREKYRRNGKR